MLNAQPHTADPADPFVAGCLEHLDEIWNYVRTCTQSHHDAEDITHDVFVQACAMRYQFAGGELGAWLYRIARNRVANHYRAKGVERRGRQVLERKAADAIADNAAPTPEKPGLDDPAQLQAALQELNETEREALRLKFSQSYSHAQMARLLEMDEAYLGVVIFRALRKLRRRLAAPKGTHS